MKYIFKNSIIVAALLFGAVSVSNAQVKVGDNPATINAGAALEIESANKGFLPPRLALTGANDATTIPSPATGMVVYNTSTVTGAVNALVPGLVVNNGTPTSPQWANVQVFTNTTGSRIDKLRYLGVVDGARTVIIDNFYELRVRQISGAASTIEIRLIQDPGSVNHVIRYNRTSSNTTTDYAYGSSLTFVGGATGTWNTYQSLENPSITGYTQFTSTWSSPQRDRLYVAHSQFSSDEFVNVAINSY